MKVKSPSKILYFVAYTLIYPVLKICFKLEADSSNLVIPKGAHIVLANHFTMVDFLFVMLSLYPHRLNAVTAQKYFLFRPLNKLLPIVGCIPKNMFDPDIRSIIGMKTVLNRGDGLLMFPEGRCSSSQAYAGIHKSTGKMIKKFGVPVIACYIEGANICLPHWRRGFRFGRVRATFSNLFSEDEIKNLTVDKINVAIDARLSGQDRGTVHLSCCDKIDEPSPCLVKPFQTRWARRLAEGLHLILYYCPKCHMEFTMTSKGNKISCTACGNEAIIGRDARLTPTPGSVAKTEISLWFREQVRHQMKSISEDMEPIIDKVKVRTPSPKPGGGLVESGFGTMRIYPEGWHFDGEISGEPVSRFFSVEAVPAMSYNHNDGYQIYYGGEFFVFVPEDPRKSIKYVILAECMHWKFSRHVLMTPGVNSGYIEQDR